MNTEIHNNSFENTANPLDNVEDVLIANNWLFHRPSQDEIMVELTGKSCTYRVFFLWQEDISAMQFCCQYDLKVPLPKREKVLLTLSTINENLWMGHFDIPEKTATPSFRQICLFRGIYEGSSIEQIEDLVEIAMAQCERYYPVFRLLATNASPKKERDLALALMEPQGEG